MRRLSMSRLFAFIMALVMVISMMPLSVFATAEGTTDGCTCDVKCVDAAPETCTVCSADLGACTKVPAEPEKQDPPPATCANGDDCTVTEGHVGTCPKAKCVCTAAKCSETEKNEACVVCTAELSKCAYVAPKCNCDTTCAEGAMKADCSVCSVEGATCPFVAQEESKEPVCSCESDCTDAVNTSCDVCKEEGTTCPKKVIIEEDNEPKACAHGLTADCSSCALEAMIAALPSADEVKGYNAAQREAFHSEKLAPIYTYAQTNGVNIDGDMTLAAINDALNSALPITAIGPDCATVTINGVAQNNADNEATMALNEALAIANSAANTDSVVITLTQNETVDLTGWTAAIATGGASLTLDGNGATITNLPQPLFDQTCTRVAVKNLTFKNSAITTVTSNGMTGAGVLFAGTMAGQYVTITNCHIIGGSIISTKYSGGFIGYNQCGWEGNKPAMIVDECSVTGVTITSSSNDCGSVGAIFGHMNNGCADIRNTTISGNKLSAVESGAYQNHKVGAVIGTVLGSDVYLGVTESAASTCGGTTLEKMIGRVVSPGERKVHISGGEYLTNPNRYGTDSASLTEIYGATADDIVVGGVLSQNSAGKWILAAAKIGDVAYGSLPAAVAAAKDGETVIAAADNSQMSGNGITVSENITIDLKNGAYEVIGNPVGTDAMKVAAGKTVTIKNGTFKSHTGSKAETLISGNVVLEKVTLDGSALDGQTPYVLSVDGGTLTMGDTVSVTGNILVSGSSAVALGKNDVSKVVVNDGAALDITGSGTIAALELASENVTVIKAADVTVTSVPKNYYWADGTLTKAVAKIGETNYASIADAVAAAKAGETVTMLENADTAITIDKNITLALGAKTLKGLTVNDGVTLAVTGTSDAAVTTFTVNGTATVTKDAAVKIPAPNMMVWDDEIKLLPAVAKGNDKLFATVNKAVAYALDNVKDGKCAVQLFADADVSITVPAGDNANNKLDFTLHMQNYTVNRLTVGGAVNVILQANEKSALTAVTIGADAMVIKHNTTVLDAPSGFVWVTENGVSSVGAGLKLMPVGEQVAMIGEVAYGSVDAAINAAKDGEEIKLLKDVSDINVPADKNVVLNLNGKTVSGSNGSAAITVAGKATIKNGTVDGDIATSQAAGATTVPEVHIAAGTTMTNGEITVPTGTTAKVSKDESVSDTAMPGADEGNMWVNDKLILFTKDGTSMSTSFQDERLPGCTGLENAVLSGYNYKLNLGLRIQIMPEENATDSKNPAGLLAEAKALTDKLGEGNLRYANVVLFARYDGGTDNVPVNETDNVITMTFPYEGRTNVTPVLWRAHTDEKGQVSLQQFELLKETPTNPKDGTFTFNAADKTVTVYSSKFSLFAYGYASTITYMYGDDVLLTETYEEGKTPEPELRKAPLVGHTQDGWYTDKKFTAASKKTHILATDTGDIVVYGKWTPNTYTVKFDSKGGKTTPDPIKVTYGEAYGKLPTVTHDTLYFHYWKDANGNRVRETDKVYIEADTTLYAHWSSVPPTGDDESMAKIAGLFILFCMSVSGMVGVAIYNKRSNGKKK